MSSALLNVEEKAGAKKRKYTDSFKIEDAEVLELESPVNFNRKFFALDKNKKHFISCDVIRTTALDPSCSSFEFESIIVSNRFKKGEETQDWGTKVPFKYAKAMHRALG